MKGRESGMPDDSYWESFFNPECILSRLDCFGVEGEVVEFGCGYGTFTIPLARNTNGRVRALDIEPEMIDKTRSRAVEVGLSNVLAEQRDFVSHGSGVSDGSAVAALLFNILHIENPVALLREARRSLKPGGIVAAIHWRSDLETPRGPSLTIRPTVEQCRSWGEIAGLEFVREIELTCCSWHWGLVLRNPAS